MTVIELPRRLQWTVLPPYMPSICGTRTLPTFPGFPQEAPFIAAYDDLVFYCQDWTGGIATCPLTHLPIPTILQAFIFKLPTVPFSQITTTYPLPQDYWDHCLPPPATATCQEDLWPCSSL